MTLLSKIKRTTRLNAMAVLGIWHPFYSHTAVGRAPAKRAFALAAMMAMLCMLLWISTPRVVLSQAAVGLLKVDVALVDKGYRLGKLMGQTVVNEKNEKIGTLDDIVLGQDRRMYAVLQVGGFLGIGSHLVAVPYDSLKIADAGKRIELPGATQEELKKLTEVKYQT